MWLLNKSKPYKCKLYTMYNKKYQQVRHSQRIFNRLGSRHKCKYNSLTHFSNRQCSNCATIAFTEQYDSECAYYCALQCSVLTECVWCACTNVKESKWHPVLCPSVSVQKLTVYQQLVGHTSLGSGHTLRTGNKKFVYPRI